MENNASNGGVVKSKKHFKIILPILLCLLLAVGYLAQVKYFAGGDEGKEVVREIEKSVKIGWVSDIHAGKEKPDSDRGYPSFPKEYKKYLEKVFSEMKSQGIDTVITTGDTTNRSNWKIAEKVFLLAKEAGMKIIFVKGNHDGPRTMEALGLTQYYYYHDLANARIIVLDNTFEREKTEKLKENEYAGYDEYYGFLDRKQLEWLKEALEVDKKILIAMHIPVFNEKEAGSQFLPRYAEFEKIIQESGRVELVISGHDHDMWERERGGVRYKSLYPLTQKTRKGTYAVIDTDDFSVEYRIGNE